MRSLVQMLAFVVILLVGVGMALEQTDVAAKPGSTTFLYLPFVSNAPTSTPAPRPLIQLGPYGGTGGDAFQDNVPDTAILTGINIHSGLLVDNVQIVLNGVAQTGHGGTGGDLHAITLNSGEYVTAITGHAGALVDSISIQTNLQTFGPFGGEGGDPFTMAAPAGYEIVGFWGHAGELVDSLGALARVHR